MRLRRILTFQAYRPAFSTRCDAVPCLQTAWLRTAWLQRNYLSTHTVIEAKSAPSNHQKSRIEILRERLGSEKLDLVAMASANVAFQTEPVDSEEIISNSHGLKNKHKLKKPSWLKVDDVSGERLANYKRLKESLKGLGLSTVCEEAKCPNISECWGGGKNDTATATIMIMGDTCTRACRFCAVKTGLTPPPLDPEEPRKVAQAITSWGLDYVVLTSVDRDDLVDQGAGHFAETVRSLKAYSLEINKNKNKKVKSILVECLTPDFRGERHLIELVATSGLDVFAHNIETVERLTPRVRDRRAGYRQSLKVLEHAKTIKQELVTKTSVMLGLGETVSEIEQTMRDCRNNGVDVITFGQYLRPSKGHLPVVEYITPEQFDSYGDIARLMGFRYVASAPLARSSYKAGELFMENIIRNGQQTPLN